MPMEELERYRQGVFYTEYVIAGADYDIFLRMRLRSPQVYHREGEGPGFPRDLPLPRARLAYEGLDGSRRRLVIPIPEEPRPRYRADPNASVSGRTYNEAMRQLDGWANYTRRLVAFLRCSSRRSVDVREPRPSRPRGSSAPTTGGEDFAQGFGQFAGGTAGFGAHPPSHSGHERGESLSSQAQRRPFAYSRLEEFRDYLFSTDQAAAEQCLECSDNEQDSE